MSIWSFIRGERAADKYKPRILKFEAMERAFIASLETNATVMATWDRLPGLETASQAQRETWQFNGDQTSVIWPSLGVEHDAKALQTYALKKK